MNKLTAIRCFANSGYCPVKSTRIYANKWYLVELQDIERDYRTDYMGLAETSTVYLFDGLKAKKERDSRLNHCNKIIEYTGNVYMVKSDKLHILEYHPNIESANKAKLKHEFEIKENLRKALESIAIQENRTGDEIIAFYGKCSDWENVEHERKAIADCKERNIKYWQSDISIAQIK
jgi:hypothetical protein